MGLFRLSKSELLFVDERPQNALIDKSPTNGDKDQDSLLLPLAVYWGRVHCHHSYWDTPTLHE